MKRTILATLVLGLVAGCATKHVVHHVEFAPILDPAGNPTGDLRITSPKDLSQGVVYALPRTVVTVTLPVERTTVDFGEFWKAYVDEVAKSEIDALFAAVTRSDGTRGIPRKPKDPSYRKKANALNLVVRRSLFDAFGELDVAAAISHMTSLASDNLPNGDPNPDRIWIDTTLTDASFSCTEATRLRRKWSTDGAGIDFAAKFPILRTFVDDDLTKLGITLSSPPATTFRIKTPTFATSSEPDLDHVYFFDVSDEFLVDRTFAMELSETGVITSGESHAVDRKLATFVQVFETAAGIAGKLAVGAQTLEATGQSTPMFQAKAIVVQIQTLRDEREKLQSGSGDFWLGNASLEGYKRIMAEMDRLEARLIWNFNNKRSATWNAKLETRPDRQPSRDELCKFSPSSGLVLRSGHKLLGLPKQGYYTDEVATAPTDKVPVILKWSTEGPGGADMGHARVLAAVERHNAGSSREQGFRYRAPRIATAKLAVGTEKDVNTQLQVDKIYGEARLAIAQFGVVLALPSSTGSSNTKLTTAYYEETGALKKVAIDSKKADTAAAIKRVGTASEGLINTRQNREITQLERRKKQLELEKAIRALESEPEN